jgi:hypothetical protein
MPPLKDEAPTIVLVSISCDRPNCDSHRDIPVMSHGKLHLVCSVCGFELHAGAEYAGKWSPDMGFEIIDPRRVPE